MKEKIIDIPRKYLAIGMCVAAAGGSSVIGELAANSYRDDLANCVDRTAENRTQDVLKHCQEEVGESSEDGYRSFAELAIIGGIVLAVFMDSDGPKSSNLRS